MGLGRKMQTKEARKELMRQANQYAARERRIGGEDWAALEREGKAGTVSRRHGGSTFGEAPPQKRLRTQGPGQFQTCLPRVPPGSLEEIRHDQACRELAVAIHEQTERAASSAKQAEQEAAEVAAWSATEKASASVSSALPSASVRSPDFEVVPFGVVPDEPMRIVQFLPPSIDMARKCLARSKWVPGLRKALQEAWEERHKPLMHSQVPACRKLDTKPVTCLELGKCFCAGKSGIVDVPLGDALASLLAKLLKRKGIC